MVLSLCSVFVCKVLGTYFSQSAAIQSAQILRVDYIKSSLDQNEELLRIEDGNRLSSTFVSDTAHLEKGFGLTTYFVKLFAEIIMGLYYGLTSDVITTFSCIGIVIVACLLNIDILYKLSELAEQDCWKVGNTIASEIFHKIPTITSLNSKEYFIQKFEQNSVKGIALKRQ